MKNSRYLIGSILLWIIFPLAMLSLAPVAQAQQANTAQITFVRPTWSDGTAIPASVGISYNVYQGIKGGAKTKVGTITTTTSTITTGLLSGNEYCFEVTAFVTSPQGPESGRSNEACKAFSGVGVVTITVQ